jgi:methylated-DNA-[protein]-cysteine S-methyltransferase
MTGESFTLFDTAIGRCAVAWTAAGVTAVVLPECSDAATGARLRRLRPGARAASPSAEAARAIAAIVALLRGEPSDSADVPLDTTGIPAFHRRVYEAVRAVAPGATSTYGAIARALGEPGAARAVGQALGRNPFVLLVPCHRVVAAGGRPGGFSAPGGLATKRRLLAIEGSPALGGPTLLDGLECGR